jgi:hypothetical protein
MILTAGVAARGHAFNFGPLFGTTIGWTGGSDWESLLEEGDYTGATRNQTAYGAAFEFEILPFLSFRPEIHLATFTGRGKGDQNTLSVSARVLHIPFLAVGKYPAGKGFAYGLLGPSMSLFLGEIDSAVSGPDSTQTFSEAPDNGRVWGITLGAGYELPVNNFKFFVDFRYNRTLSLIFNDNDAVFQSIGIMTGLVFSVPMD